MIKREQWRNPHERDGITNETEEEGLFGKTMEVSSVAIDVFTGHFILLCV